MAQKMKVMIACVVACAGSKPETKAAAPTENKQRMKNVVPFDLANCFPLERTPPKPANEVVLNYQI